MLHVYDMSMSSAFSAFLAHITLHKLDFDKTWLGFAPEAPCQSSYLCEKCPCLTERKNLKCDFSSSVTVIFRDKEIDVDAGDTRLVILIHERNGKKIFWPALRQRSQDPNIEGILGE